jgi:hypothetical protein
MQEKKIKNYLKAFYLKKETYLDNMLFLHFITNCIQQ